MKRFLFLVISFGLLVVQLFGQAIPREISYQGVLNDAAGYTVADGVYSITFRLYSEASGGTALWSEQQSVTVEKGLFSVYLGSVNPLSAVPFDQVCFLGMTIGTGSELLPRTKLTPAPYSLMAMNVMDQSITSDKIVDGAIINTDINNAADISISKISGDAGLEYKTWGSTFYSVPENSETVIDMGNITLTAPTSGYVVVWLAGYTTFMGDQKTLDLGINIVNTSITDDASVSIGRMDGSGTLRFRESFHAMGVFAVSEGNSTFYALVQGNTTFGVGVADVFPQTMTAIFIPKRY